MTDNEKQVLIIEYIFYAIYDKQYSYIQRYIKYEAKKYDYQHIERPFDSYYLVDYISYITTEYPHQTHDETIKEIKKTFK